ncbi:hypothetical protein P691DRAFT_777663 [Macrolepiota fuliginosa MF-IS2]|uniref:Microbial-type PARG catalytic domain-containing protein n=1 Tax=Macrolepiota fuliginosa MF-IS2 TaxID=1400762 RepID=A0A9P5X9M7_9AGAR|nr:hypothetical protein P691DRAFT_777663 [Macrolepiota fuliginosa MF-IS2]
MTSRSPIASDLQYSTRSLRMPDKAATQDEGLPRGFLRKIAIETMAAIEAGSYTVPMEGSHSKQENIGEVFDLRKNVENLQTQTLYYGSDSTLSSWAQSKPEEVRLVSERKIWAVETSTIETARRIVQIVSDSHPAASAGNVQDDDVPRGRGHAVGILNFASAKSPGGGFLNGSRAQEESIARSSTLYHSLTSPTGQQYYEYNKSIITRRNDGHYSHAMVYSPSVLVFRDDNGGWIHPYEVDIVTSAAVNAGVVRQKRQRALDKGQEAKSEEEMEGNIYTTMKERMGRLLYLFELQGVRNVVLGSFGTGAFKNSVDMIMDIWTELLDGVDARFGKSFERVVFGVIGNETYLKFAERFGVKTG